MAKLDIPVYMRMGNGPEVQIGVIVGDSYVGTTSPAVATNSRHRNVDELLRRAYELNTGDEVKAKFADDLRGVIELRGPVYVEGNYMMVGGWIIGRYSDTGVVTEISSLLTYLRKVT